MIYNKDYFALTGYKVIPDVKLVLSDTEIRILEKVDKVIDRKNGSRKSKERLIRNAVLKYPNTPQLLDMYLVFRSEERQDLGDIVNRYERLFPDYAIGKLLCLNFLGMLDKWEEMNVQLGNRNPCEFFNKELLTRNELLSFFATAVEYENKHQNFTEGEKWLKFMFLLDMEDGHTVDTAFNLEKGRLIRNMEVIEKSHIINSFPNIKFKQVEEGPRLNHHQIYALYHYKDYDLPEKTIDEVFALPRESAVEDLVAVLQDGMYRYDYFYKLKEYVEEEQSFMIHAILFLGAMERTEQLPLFFHILRQGDEFIRHWFSEEVAFYLDFSMYSIAKDQLDVLKDFYRESNISSIARHIVCRVVLQVSRAQPERKDECLAWFKDVFDFLIDNHDNPDAVDLGSVTFTIIDYLLLKPSHILPHLNKLAELNLYDFSMLGELAELEEKINRPSTEDSYPSSQKEYFSKTIYSRLEKSDEELGKIINRAPDFEQYLAYIYGEVNADFLAAPVPEFKERQSPHYHRPVNLQESSQQAVKSVGRNEPCPCGSGQKYKRCCL